MHPAADETKPASRLRLDFRAGGWVILLAGLLVLGVLAWQGWIIATHRPAAGGAGPNGFDLSVCLIPRERIVEGMPRGAVVPLLDPPALPLEQMAAFRDEYGKYLVPGDRVIGVEINGQARAYPLRVLNWHEVCNDTLGGELIAVTYHPLCDSAVVFRRRIGQRTLRFAASGLLYNSNLLMYDLDASPGRESLWSQLQFRAIAGPAAAAGQTLEIVPAQLVYWEDWQQRYPGGTVLRPDPANRRRYRRNPYGPYFNTDELRYPVAPLPPTEPMDRKTPVVAVATEQGWQVFPLPRVVAQADPAGEWRPADAGTGLVFEARRMQMEPPTAWVSPAPGAPSPKLVHAFWFAWYSMHPPVEQELRRSEALGPVDMPTSAGEKSR